MDNQNSNSLFTLGGQNPNLWGNLLKKFPVIYGMNQLLGRQDWDWIRKNYLNTITALQDKRLDEGKKLVELFGKPINMWSAAGEINEFVPLRYLQQRQQLGMGPVASSTIGDLSQIAQTGPRYVAQLTGKAGQQIARTSKDVKRKIEDVSQNPAATKALLDSAQDAYSQALTNLALDIEPYQRALTTAANIYTAIPEIRNQAYRTNYDIFVRPYEAQLGPGVTPYLGAMTEYTPILPQNLNNPLLEMYNTAYYSQGLYDASTMTPWYYNQNIDAPKQNFWQDILQYIFG